MRKVMFTAGPVEGLITTECCKKQMLCYLFELKCKFISAEWVDRVDSKMIYERKQGSQVLYVLPITHVL